MLVLWLVFISISIIGTINHYITILYDFFIYIPVTLPRSSSFTPQIDPIKRINFTPPQASRLTTNTLTLLLLSTFTFGGSPNADHNINPGTLRRQLCEKPNEK